jgi:parallel beta-helix repeat protein
MNPYGHADYDGSADCVGTYISNNYIKNVDENSIMEWTLNLMGQSDNTSIINNTIVNGDIGISMSGKANNVRISGNTIVNCTASIIAGANGVVISDNFITGSSMDVGITIFPDEMKYVDNADVFNNTIVYDNLYKAISIGRGANVYDNTIKLSKYGVGISDGSNNSNISGNRIYVLGDDGILLNGNNSFVSNNIIHTKANGISSISKNEKLKVYNNTIRSNKIYSDKYGVYIEGYVYNTTISDNYIETNESDAFHVDMYMTRDDRNPGQIADNTINGVIRDTEILVIDDINFYDYFDDEEINLNLELGRHILVIADLGLWNGRHSGYKEIGTNLRDCLCSNSCRNHPS